MGHFALISFWGLRLRVEELRLQGFKGCVLELRID